MLYCAMQEYTCQISAYKPTEITHSVRIRVEPVIAVSPESALVVNEGSAAQLSCSVLAGSPAPQLSWSRYCALYSRYLSFI